MSGENKEKEETIEKKKKEKKERLKKSGNKIDIIWTGVRNSSSSSGIGNFSWNRQRESYK